MAGKDHDQMSKFYLLLFPHKTSELISSLTLFKIPVADLFYQTGCKEEGGVGGGGV